MQNNNYQNRNNRGYTPPTNDNGFNNQNYNRPLYAAPAPGGSYNKKSNTGLIAAISGLSVLLVAVLIFAVLWFSGAIGSSSSSVPASQPMSVPTESQSASTDQTPQSQPVTMYVANVKNSIYFRSAPTEDSSNIICEIPFGTAVTFLENTDAVFAKISYNGTDGYVKREYLSSTQPQKQEPQYPSASSGNTSISEYMYVANVKNSIYLRSQPVENSSNIMGEIPLGTRIGFIENTNNVFCKIYYNGKYGYVKRMYLSSSAPVSSGSSSRYMTVCNVKTSIYLRNAPVENSGNIICEIPVGSTVEFLENANGTFYKIRWNGKVGYSKAEYLR